VTLRVVNRTRDDEDGNGGEIGIAVVVEDSVEKAILDFERSRRVLPRSPVTRSLFDTIFENKRVLSRLILPEDSRNARRLIEDWNDIQLTPLENLVLETLRIVAPDIERIALLLDPESPTGVFFAQMSEGPRAGQRVPLKTFGQAVSRVFGLVLALVKNRNGVVLVDEVENGIHWTIMEQFWKSIFDISKSLNVQLFATTHSYDCVRSFIRVAHEKPEVGTIYRLASAKNGGLNCFSFSEEELVTVLESNVEIR
jgi:AAA domain, putative AbiEii toxin, Type IV TA system